MAKKYMLITVEDRDIMAEQFHTLAKARAAMYDEMQTWGGVPPEVFEENQEEYEAEDHSFGFVLYGGWVNKWRQGTTLDWSIVAL